MTVVRTRQGQDRWGCNRHRVERSTDLDECGGIVAREVVFPNRTVALVGRSLGWIDSKPNDPCIPSFVTVPKPTTKMVSADRFPENDATDWQLVRCSLRPYFCNGPARTGHDDRRRIARTVCVVLQPYAEMSVIELLFGYRSFPHRVVAMVSLNGGVKLGARRPAFRVLYARNRPPQRRY